MSDLCSYRISDFFACQYTFGDVTFYDPKSKRRCFIPGDILEEHNLALLPFVREKLSEWDFPSDTDSLAIKNVREYTSYDGFGNTQKKSYTVLFG